MEVREDLKYIRTHQWVKQEGNVAVLGITDYAQAQLRAIVFVNLPEVGDSVTAGESFAEVESVKVVSEVHSPVSGIVCEVNEDLMDEPEKLNEAPYEHWLVKVDQITETADLLSAEEYQTLLNELQSSRSAT